MFLEGKKQIERLENYNSLKKASEKATFTYRMVEKIKRFLDDVAEVNNVLDTIPFKSHKKAFKPEHIEPVFDLLEMILAGQGVAPVTHGVFGTGDEKNQYVFKAFGVVDVEGKQGRYSTTRPATPEEIELNEKLKKRIERLNRFVYPQGGIPGPEFLPREYFDGLVEQAEKAGLKPIFEGREE